MPGIVKGCDRLREVSKRCCQRLCPCLGRVLRSPAEKYRPVKALFGFPVGLALGAAMYYAVISKMRMPEFTRYALGGLFVVGFSGGFALSTQARCVILLMVPTFCGKSGRSYIGAFAVAFLLSGPIANIMHNAHEVSRSIGCSIVLSHNLTSSRLKLRFQPIKDIMVDLQKQGANIHTVSARVRKEFAPVALEVEDEEELGQLKSDTNYVDSLSQKGPSRVKTIDERHNKRKVKKVSEKKANNYERKLDYRCEDVFSVGVKRCRKAFRDAENRCFKAIPVVGALFCLPLKLTVICELIRLVPGATGLKCDSTETINEGFGDGYQTALDAANALDKNFEVNMQYKVVTSQEAIDRRTAAEVSKDIAYEFDRRQVWFNTVMDLVNTMMAFLFIQVLLGSFKYHKKFSTDFKHDNIYMTAYYRRIDARRYNQAKRTLLPLKKVEKKELIQPLRISLTGPERKKLVKGTMKLLLRLFTFLTIILVDRLIFECLDIIRRHSRIDYKQTGSHEISLTVHGKGVMGHLVKSLLRGFNVKHAVNDLASNLRCLPRPSRMPNEYVSKIALVLAATWGLMLIDAYALRLRSSVAGFFYPKREKKRILFLYNEMLKKRKGFLRHTRHEVRRRAKERTLSTTTGLLTSLRLQWPRLCGWLRMLGLGKRHCLICEEPDSRAFNVCQTPGCNFGYCGECWIDIKKRCYACLPEEDLDSDSDLTDRSGDDTD